MLTTPFDTEKRPSPSSEAHSLSASRTRVSTRDRIVFRRAGLIQELKDQGWRIEDSGDVGMRSATRVQTALPAGQRRPLGHPGGDEESGAGGRSGRCQPAPSQFRYRRPRFIRGVQYRYAGGGRVVLRGGPVYLRVSRRDAEAHFNGYGGGKPATPLVPQCSVIELTARGAPKDDCESHPLRRSTIETFTSSQGTTSFGLAS